MPHGCRLPRPRLRRELVGSAVRAGYGLRLHHGLRLILSIVVSFVVVPGTVEHPFEQEQEEDQEQSDDLDRAESVQGHRGSRKALLLIFSRNVPPVDQSVYLNDEQHQEYLREVILAWLDLLELVRLVRLPLPLPTVEVLLPPMHVLWQHLPVEVADGIEESLDSVPGLLIPGTLLVDENLVVLVREEVELLVLVTYI